MMKDKTKAISAFLLALTLAAAVEAQVAVDVSAGGVRVQTGSGGTSAAVNGAGTIASDVEMEGVAVINDEVFIDGEKVPRGRTSYKSKKTGKSYRIKWGGNGSVAVQEK